VLLGTEDAAVAAPYFDFLIDGIQTLGLKTSSWNSPVQPYAQG